MLRVGLTGSIATGKSFVSGVLAGRVVEPGTEGLRAVVEEFGAEVLDADGALDRARLGALVFGDARRRGRLNSILHPLIYAEQEALLRRWEEEDPRAVGVVDAALLIESGGYRRFDKLVVVHCRPGAQLERLMRRNNLSREEAGRRIASQMPQEEKLRYADFSVDTSGSFEETRARTEDVYKALRRIADEADTNS
jgi:dephospho-CoA kinase